MATENIEIIFTTDDSSLMQSFEDISQQAEDLQESAEEVEGTLNKAFRPRNVQQYGKALEGTTKKLDDQNKQVKKNDVSMSSFNKTGGRGISMLSRFGGVGGKVTRSLGGLAFALGGTPFGAFALAAGAATAAYALFADKLGLNNDAIIAKNKELRDSINQLAGELKDKFQEGKLLAIDLSNLSDTEKGLAKIQIISENIGANRLLLAEKGVELQNEENKQINNVLKTETERLENEKRILELKSERQTLATEEINNENKIVQIQKEGVATSRAAREERAKDLQDLNKLFESLVRNELEKRLQALDNEAKAREAQAQQLKVKQSEIDRFILDSQKTLETDKAIVRKEFADAELKARQALFSQLANDEEKAAKEAAQIASENRLIQIEDIAKDDAEKSDLIKQNAIKLQSDLDDITKQFDEKRKAENLAKEQEIFSLKSASLESQILREEQILEKKQELDRQAFASISHTEEEITAFKEGQDDARLTAELKFQIERLQLVKEFNKEITDFERAALDAQIATLETRLQGVGAKIQKTAKDGAKKGDGLFGLLGISADTQSDIQAVQGALEQVTTEISKAVGERIELLQKEIDFRSERISEIQADLANEIELNKLGKASNIKELQDELNSEKAARAKAQQEKKEAAEAQFALDTVIQASNLITAISGLYSSLAGLPFGIGVAIATALAAVMVGSFIASKASAADAAGFAGGGYTGDIGTKQVAGDVHGQEFVIDAKTTEELGLRNKSMEDAKSILFGSHISDNMPNFDQNRKKNKAMGNQLAANEVQRQRAAHAMYNDTVTKAVNEGNKTLKAILNKPTVIPLPNGTTKVITGNTTEIYK